MAPRTWAARLTFTTSATTASGVGNYSVSASGLTNNTNTTQYDFVYINGTPWRDAGAVDRAGKQRLRPYGSANPAFTAFCADAKPSCRMATRSLRSAPSPSPARQARGQHVGSYPIVPQGLSTPELRRHL